MKTLAHAALLFLALVTPAVADDAKNMRCPIMPGMEMLSGKDMQVDMQAMMTDMQGMMKIMADPAMKERMAKMHDRMGAMMKQMGGIAPPEPAPPVKPDDHEAHHPEK